MSLARWLAMSVTRDPRAQHLITALQPRSRVGSISLTLLSRGGGSSAEEQSRHSLALAWPRSRLTSASSPGIAGMAGLVSAGPCPPPAYVSGQVLWPLLPL